MSKMIRVNVTQEHIDEGVRYSSRECPIALAIREAAGDRASVGLESTIILGKLYWLPQVMIDWLRAYDHGERVHPVEFDLELP